MRGSVESLNKVKIKQCKLFTPIHQASCFITEGCQICQAWFPVPESMLTTPSQILVIHIYIWKWFPGIWCTCYHSTTVHAR